MVMDSWQPARLETDILLLFQVRLMEKRVNHSEWSQDTSNEDGYQHSQVIDGLRNEPSLHENQEVIIKQLECEVEQQVRPSPCPYPFL